MRYIFTATTAAILLTVISCGKAVNSSQNGSNVFASDSSHFISIDSANKMLGSYLNSINYTTNDTDLQSMVIDVASLRKYIDSMPGSDSITQLKLMFAHTLNYATLHANTNAGYKSGALTIIIAASSVHGNYVLYNNQVMDYSSPCPPV
ncbi:MAG TPA: hypothetical protein VHA52_05200, partial [Candidatus Babeliaceae bacterium]|nr:hypothetical protein [Candidatus Babeliaceae bacterium]